MSNRDRSPGLCPASRALLLTRKSNLQFGWFFLSSPEFNLLGGREIVEPASAVGNGIYDASIQSEHFLLAFRNCGLWQNSSRFEAEANKPFAVRLVRNRDLPWLFVLAMTNPL